MSSLCKPASQAQTIQGLTLDRLVSTPQHRYKKKTQRSESSKQHSIYWTEKLAISDSSTTLSPYYTALALGATVVCSAGALMQYTNAEPQHSSDQTILDKTLVQSEQSESTTTVVTPPIAASQTTASFSTRSESPDTNCEDGTCQGQIFNQQHKSPQAQLPPLNAAREEVQAKSTLHKLQSQQAILAHRSDDLAQRQIELVARSEQLNQQFIDLTNRLGIHPEDAAQVSNLLDIDTTYQVNRLRLSGLKTAIAIEYSKPVVDNSQLEVLYGQYAQELEQLRHLAQDVLAKYIVDVSAGLSEPIWQDEEYYGLLRALMDVAHLRQMQIIEHNTLAQMNAQLSQQRTELAVLLEKNNSLKAFRAS